MYELIALECTKTLAPWLWETYDPSAKSQSRFFGSERSINRWQFNDLALDVEAVVAFAASALADNQDGSMRRGRLYFDYEIDAVRSCVLGLEAFLARRKHVRDSDFDAELTSLRKLLKELLVEVRLPSGLKIEMAANKYRPRLKPDFLSRRATDSSGLPISKELDEPTWLNLRKTGLTSSDAGGLIRLNGERRAGWRALFETKLPGYEAEFFNSFTLGVEREPKIAEWVIEHFPTEGFFHNEFTYISSEDKRLMSTPDMVGDFAVCEIKVSSRDLKTNLQRYRDQIQWHMLVLDAPVCLFVVENRYDRSMSFEWVEANEVRIAALVEAAEEWLEEFAKWLNDGDSF